MHEMNGLPDWAPDLIEAHAEAFDAAVIPELSWELSLPPNKPEPHHMVSTLQYAPERIRERYRPNIERLLEENEPAHVHTLESALSTLLQWDGLDTARFGALAQHRYKTSEDAGRRLQHGWSHGCASTRTARSAP